MKKLTTALLGAATTSQAFAHGGHGVDVGSAFHYLSAPHLFVSIGVAVSVVAVGYVLIRARRQKD